MKRNWLLAAFIVLCLETMAQSKDEQALANAVSLLNKAIVDADSSALVNLTAARLSYGHSNGKVEDKATFIQTVLHGPLDMLSIDVSALQINVAGKGPL